MKNILILVTFSFFILSCEKSDNVKSIQTIVSIPDIVENFTDPSYISATGTGGISALIPDTVGVAVDSIVGFANGFGGKTGKDTVYVLKSDLVAWPDTTSSGASTLSFEVFNLSNYKAVIAPTLILAGPLSNPGPSDLSGSYQRTSNGFIIDLTLVNTGVYLLTNHGGAAVDDNPTLLYNYRSSLGTDSLDFPAQTSSCGNALNLVSPSAPNALTIQQYDNLYPPQITSLSPITFSWKVFEFADTSPSTTHPGAALCAWGLAVRTFVKQ